MLKTWPLRMDVHFSPVENVMASHNPAEGFRCIYRLWEVNAEGLTVKAAVLDEVMEDVTDGDESFGCTFSRDGKLY